MTDERDAARQALTVAVLLVDADAPDEQGGRRLQEAVVGAAFDAGAGARPHRVRVLTAAVTRAAVDAR